MSPNRKRWRWIFFFVGRCLDGVGGDLKELGFFFHVGDPVGGEGGDGWAFVVALVAKLYNEWQ